MHATAVSRRCLVRSWNDKDQQLLGTDLSMAAAFAGMSPQMALGVQAGQWAVCHGQAATDACMLC
jgi:hypothetical protein